MATVAAPKPRRSSQPGCRPRGGGASPPEVPERRPGFVPQVEQQGLVGDQPAQARDIAGMEGRSGVVEGG